MQLVAEAFAEGLPVFQFERAIERLAGDRRRLAEGQREGLHSRFGHARGKSDPQDELHPTEQHRRSKRPLASGREESHRRQRRGDERDDRSRAERVDQHETAEERADDRAECSPGVNVADRRADLATVRQRQARDHRRDRPQCRRWQKENHPHDAHDPDWPAQAVWPLLIAGDAVQPQHAHAQDAGGQKQPVEQLARCSSIGQPATEKIADRDPRQHNADDRGPGVERVPHMLRDQPRGGQFQHHDANAGHEDQQIAADQNPGGVFRQSLARRDMVRVGSARPLDFGRIAIELAERLRFRFGERIGFSGGDRGLHRLIGRSTRRKDRGRRGDEPVRLGTRGIFVGRVRHVCALRERRSHVGRAMIAASCLMQHSTGTLAEGYFDAATRREILTKRRP